MKPDLDKILRPADADRIENAIRRGATRRELLGMLIAGGMGTALAGTVIGHATKAYADTPKKGGSIRAAGYSSGTTDTLDPAKQSLSTDYVRCTGFYNGLTRLDDKLAPEMELAESFDTDDAVTWTVKLRKGVTFHDGSTFTADDVVYSLNRHKDPAIGSKAKSLADQIADVKKAGDNEVTIVLTGPNADLPVILGTFHFLIVKNGTTNFTTANGTGPFKCKEFRPGVHSVAVRNENYWRGNGPYLDQVEFFAIADENARVNALLSGDVQLIGSIDPRSTQLVKASRGFELMTTTAGNYTDLNMRLDTAPGKDPNFVEAMKLLLDREQIKSAVFRGYAEVANDQPVPPSNRFYNADLPQRKYDPDKAKSLLTKSGLIGAKIPVIASTAASQSVEMAVLIQQAASEVGLNIDVQKVPADGYWSNYWLKAPVHFGNINPRPTADILFSLLYLPSAPWNESHWKSERFDKILVEARKERDDAKRKEMYGELQKMARDESGVAIPVFISNIDAHSSKLKGLRPMATGGLMGFAFSEHVWLEA
jgi:peptide/nickel transport system substrate-binding protein